MDPQVMNTNKKHTMGRRKIEMKKIEEKSSRQVTFSKRRTGLFRKANELCILSGAEAAIFVVSQKGKIFTFGHPSVEAIIGRYMQDNNNSNSLEGSSENYSQTLGGPFFQISENLEKLRALEAERNRLKAMNKHNLVPMDVYGRGANGNWWDKKIEGMELEELEKFRESLKELKKKVELKAVEKDMKIKMSDQIINSGDIDVKQLEMDVEDRNSKAMAIVPQYDDYAFGFPNLDV